MEEKRELDFPSRRLFSGFGRPAQRVPSLDGLRGISIWAVMFAHASSHFVGKPVHFRKLLNILAPLSYFGVTTFFVISGFLITMLLLREDARTSRIDLGQFYRRRAARILPAVLFYIAIVLLFARVTISQALYALTFTTTYFFEQAAKPFQQLWSLSVEEQFYLLWPLVLSFGIKSAKRSCWAILFVSPVVRLSLKHYGYTQCAHLAPAIGDSLAAGCLLAFYENSARTFARKYFLSTSAFLALGAVTVGMACIVYWWDVVLLWGLIPCLLAMVISASIERKDNSGVLVWTGLLSYSLYLWQQPFLVFDGPANHFLARILMTFSAAYISYRFIEQPVLRVYGRRRRESQLANAVVPAV
jgi:peptidoglycan/LPS O-acetylase OafA/YrhL